MRAPRVDYNACMMSRLLRMLLILALVLDGTAAATAAVRMQRTALEVPAATTVAAGCHGAHAVATEHPRAHAAHLADPTTSSAAHAAHAGAAMADAAAHAGGAACHDRSAPDCCDSGACPCACMQPAQPPATAWSATPMPAQTHGPGPLSLGHADPALPPLHRPPIA
ncbi:hypothetical protein EDC50_0882 [Vulcaniibacterium tengchongense]|uniref:Uncharacterized protein n=3 Tax=Vulcaniibacterium tengchongense TaxID=1273429 RepID=A0A3N4VX52_9GAMM|nr:hypothetical protein EDC50_0882 [Vulcaniibacterium tengchongense]